MIDWRRHNNRLWIVVDPLSMKHGRVVLLYLTDPAYQRMSRISLSNEVDLEVIATPDDSRETVGEFAKAWDERHPESNSGPATVTSPPKPSEKSPPVMGRTVQREEMVDGWVKFYERFLSPLLKVRAPKEGKVK